MATIWDAVSRFFGPSQNDRFAELLLQLADTAVACAAHFRETGGQDLAGIIDYNLANAVEAALVSWLSSLVSAVCTWSLKLPPRPP